MEGINSGIEEIKNDIRVFTSALEALVKEGKFKEAAELIDILNDPKIRERMLELYGDDASGNRVYDDFDQTISE
jgi:hypothetical protein